MCLIHTSDHWSAGLQHPLSTQEHSRSAMVLNHVIAWLVLTVLSLWEFRCVLGNGQAFLLILKPQPLSNHEYTFIYKKRKQAKLHLTDGSVLKD